MVGENILNFTKPSLKNLPPAPPDKAFMLYYDTQVKGLTLMVSPLGTKTFYFSKKIRGRSEKIKIGRTVDRASRTTDHHHP